MPTIYLSSTYADLKDYREAAARTLRKMGHEVIGMEDYVASDDRPLNKCLRDVGAADLYLGIFAWRYGFVPKHEKAQPRSITELEYRRALELKKPCLIFLLHEHAPWPAAAIDAVAGKADDARRIARLRAELKNEKLVSFFRSPDELAREVSVAVYLQLELQSSMEASMRDTEKALPGELADTKRVRFGSTLFPEIDRKLSDAVAGAESELLEVNLGGGRKWWSTRLYLLAALATDFVEVQQIVFLAGRGRFVGLASPAAVRRALTTVHPQLLTAYRPGPDAASTIRQFSLGANGLGPGGEQGTKVWVTEELLGSWLGRDLVSRRVDSPGAPVTPLLLFRILERPERFVPLVDHGRLVGIIDRLDLATRVATGVLTQHLETPEARR